MNHVLKNGITFLIVAILLVSCASKEKKLELKSPNEDIVLSFYALKPNMFEPFNVTMQIEGFGKSKSLTFDMYNSDFNTETVLADWKDENSFVLTFKQSDGDNRVMDVYLSAEEIRLRER